MKRFLNSHTANAIIVTLLSVICVTMIITIIVAVMDGNAIAHPNF